MICGETDSVVARLVGCEREFAVKGSGGLHYDKS
jgi:hypothetical protein